MSENDMAKIARPVADPHADKDAEIYDAEHVAAIAEFNEKAALARVAELEAAWTDDKGTTCDRSMGLCAIVSGARTARPRGEA